MKKDFHIRIFQPIVPEYRVALFEGLGMRYKGRIDVWADKGSGQDRSYPLKCLPLDDLHPFKKIGTFCWQTGFSLKGLSRGDVVVVCGDVHQLSSIWIAFRARLHGIKVIWWGHHLSATSGKFGFKLRLLLAKMFSDVYLCYTHSGAEWLRKHGFANRPVFATGNTIYQKPICEAVSNWDDGKLSAWQKEHELAGKEVLLCCSVLRPKVRFEQLIEALATEVLSKRKIVLAVIGTGSQKEALQALAEKKNVADKILWLGEMRSQEDMAPWFLSAKIFVYPGSIGLSILHAFSYGLPLVTHDNVAQQMPEFEAMEDGKTGLLFAENDIADLAKKICILLDDDKLRSFMSEYAKQVAFRDYSMDAMVSNFASAVEYAASMA